MDSALAAGKIAMTTRPSLSGATSGTTAEEPPGNCKEPTPEKASTNDRKSSIVGGDTLEAAVHERDKAMSAASELSGGPEAEIRVSLTREELDAKLSRNELKIESILNERLARIDIALARNFTKLDAVVLATAIVGILLSVIAFGGDRFDGGVQFGSASNSRLDRVEQGQTQMDARLDRLTTAVQALVDSQTSSSGQTSAKPPSR